MLRKKEVRQEGSKRGKKEERTNSFVFLLMMPQIHFAIAFSLRVLWRGLALPSCDQPGKNPGGPRNMFFIDIRRKPMFSLPLAYYLPDILTLNLNHLL